VLGSSRGTYRASQCSGAGSCNSFQLRLFSARNRLPLYKLWYSAEIEGTSFPHGSELKPQLENTNARVRPATRSSLRLRHPLRFCVYTIALCSYLGSRFTQVACAVETT
jgi:hypothetical protein